MRTQKEMLKYVLSLSDIYDDERGWQVKGSIAAVIEVLTNVLLSEEQKDEIIKLMREQKINGTEPHLLRADICNLDRDLFAQYILDGTAKQRLYELDWYERATGRKRQKSS